MTLEKIMKHHTEGGRMIRHYNGKKEYILSEDDMNFILGLVNNLDIPVVSVPKGTLPNNGLANWAQRNHWTYNFVDGKWWQLQESHNYIKLTTEEMADLCKKETT